MVDLTRRAFLQGAAGAAALATIPFGLKADDFTPVEKEIGGNLFELQDGERLVLKVDAPPDAIGDVSVYAASRFGK